MVRMEPRARAGFQQVRASVPPRPRRPHQGVHLVYEEDDLALGFLHLLHYGLEAFLELATVLGAGDEAPMSRATSLLFFKFSGTSPSIMRRARPSTMAVFPTPARRWYGIVLGTAERDLHHAAISSSRPITGSSLFMRATLSGRVRISQEPRTAPRLFACGALAARMSMSTSVCFPS